jgi:hypothetical protein
MSKFYFVTKDSPRPAAFNFDPLGVGFQFDRQTACCLYFVKDEYELRVRIVEKTIILYKGESRALVVDVPIIDQIDLKSRLDAYYNKSQQQSIHDHPGHNDLGIGR